MIVAHEVTNVGHDRDQLANMAKLAKGATGARELIALADRGYYEGYEILECERAAIAAVVPKPMTSNNLANGFFDKRDFVYDERKDEYRCPAGQIAIYRSTKIEKGKTLHRYWSSACPAVPDEAAMHDRLKPAHRAMGARERPRHGSGKVGRRTEAMRLRGRPSSTCSGR
jgi:hypothetical protein